MLTLITPGGGVPLRVDDYYIKELASGLDELCFSISIWDEQYQAIQEESSIFEQSDGKSAYYLVKAIDGGAETANIKCQIDLDEWRATFNLSYDSGTASVGEIVNTVKPTGWTVINNSGIIYRRTVRLEGATAQDVIEKCRTTFQGVSYRFDNVNKVVEIVNLNSGPNLGAFATRDLHLKRTDYKGKSTGFATRLYAYGKDGMSFASINGGKPYVENHDYSSRVICAYWTDERYTVPQNLLADAQAKVDEMARPQRSFDCDVVDLAKTNPEKYSELDFQLFSFVGLIDQTRANQKINHQIVELWRYPYYPDKNKVVLSTVAPRIQSQLTQVFQSINNVNSDWSQQQAAYYDTLSAAILGAKGGSVRLLDTDGDGEPDTLYIADSPDPETAEKVWRFNYQGWAASQNGYNGPFSLGATFDDGGTLYANILKVLNINASNISTGTLSADRIAANSIAVAKLTGTISAKGYPADTVSWSLNLTDGTLTIGNVTADKITAGTLAAARIAANSIAVSKLTGAITNGNWKIDLDAGTLTIGNISADNINTGTLNADNINVTNINGANIKAQTIGATPLASGAVVERVLNSGAVTEDKLADLSVSNGKIGNSAVSYGKTSFTGTLDQVGTNASNINALSGRVATVEAGYFNSISTNSIAMGNYYFYVANGYVRASEIG